MKSFVVMLVVALMCSVAWGLGPIGNPTATLDAGQMGLGYDYTRSQQDVELIGLGRLSGTLDNVGTDLHIGTLSYGVTDNLEIWGRLGAAKVDAGTIQSDGERLLGVGVKATVLEFDGSLEGVSVGVSAQANWLRMDDAISKRCRGEQEINVDVTEIILAVGPSLKLGDLSVYAGPAIYQLSGRIDVGDNHGRIREGTSLIGFAGASLNITDNLSVRGGYQQGKDFQVYNAGVVLAF